jgi:hypothetical protein
MREPLAGLILRILRVRDQFQIRLFVNFFELGFSADVLRATRQTTSYLLGASCCRLCFCALFILRGIEIESLDEEDGNSSIFSFFAGLCISTFLGTFLIVSFIASDFTDFSVTTVDSVDS